MKQTLIQTYHQSKNWKSGQVLKKIKVVEKLVAHDQDLLHLSSHLLILDGQKRILCRKRKVDDFRYADLWTTSIGTHVLLGNDYYSTLKQFLPIEKEIEFVGEFRVHDEWENEVNGLYLLKSEAESLPQEFLSDKQFFSSRELESLIKLNKTTPHLATQESCKR